MFLEIYSLGISSGGGGGGGDCVRLGQNAAEDGLLCFIPWSSALQVVDLNLSGLSIYVNSALVLVVNLCTQVYS